MKEDNMENPLSFFKDKKPPQKNNYIDVVEFMRCFFPFDSETEEEALSAFEGFEYYNHSLHTDDFSYFVSLETHENGNSGLFNIDRIEYLSISPNGKEVLGKAIPALKARLKKVDGQLLEATEFQVMSEGLVEVSTLSDIVRFASYRAIDGSNAGFHPIIRKVSLNNGQMTSFGAETKVSKKCCGGCNG